jgi:hypothetical protein
MINSNKITNTKIGDDIHFYINGTEDRGIVVKMNNEYVTVFKESTQEFDDIHINDTFFIKDILVNKEWDKMDDDERYDALNKIHAPTPRFIMKSWNDLPKEIKELLTKNNAIETSHKEGKDDDMNVVDTREGWDTNKTLNQTSSGKVRSKLNPKGQVGDVIPDKKPDEGEDEPLDAGDKVEPRGYQKNPEAIEQHQRPKEFRSDITAPDKQQGDKNVTGIDFLHEGGGGIGAGEHKLGGQSAADRQSAEFKVGQDRKQAKIQAEKDKPATDKKVTAGMKRLKAWQLWLAKREQEVLKDDREAARAKETERDAKGTARQRSLKLDEAGAAQAAADKLKPEKATWKSWLDNKKTNSERSIHGNAAREPNSGVNTNIGFDASEDYEGFTHSGVRPEQFKHERKKPKATTKERINIGETYPSKAGQGTGDGGNPYDTRTQNKTEKGRAKQGKDRN